MKTEINSLIVKEYGMDVGANLVGIASASDFASAPDGCKPSDVLPGCCSVVVLGAAHPQEALGSVDEYTAMRNAMVTKMTDMAKNVEKQIKANGYRAKAISATGCKTVDGVAFGAISLKHAAQLAGFGVITRNYLLTNDKYGNLLWLSAVLTDADLVPDEKAEYEFCGSCNKCAVACPVGALNDTAVFGRNECRKFFKIVNKKLEIQCFLCRTVCPYRFGKE